MFILPCSVSLYDISLKSKIFPINLILKKLFSSQCKIEKNWPPSDSSPFHPIEPWGKQFFVFNAIRLKNPNTSDFISNTNLLPKYKEGPYKEETVLCVTDYRKKPLMYLIREDFNYQSIDSIYDELLSYEKKLDKIPNDNRLELQKELIPRRSFRMQKTKKAEHSSYGIFKGARRMKK